MNAPRPAPKAPRPPPRPPADRKARRTDPIGVLGDGTRIESVVGEPPLPPSDSTLLELGVELDQRVADENDAGRDSDVADDDWEVIHGRTEATLERIANTPATSIRGLAVKGRAAAWAAQHAGETIAGRLQVALLADIAVLASGCADGDQSDLQQLAQEMDALCIRMKVRESVADVDSMFDDQEWAELEKRREKIIEQAFYLDVLTFGDLQAQARVALQMLPKAPTGEIASVSTDEELALWQLARGVLSFDHIKGSAIATSTDETVRLAVRAQQVVDDERRIEEAAFDRCEKHGEDDRVGRRFSVASRFEEGCPGFLSALKEVMSYTRATTISGALAHVIQASDCVDDVIDHSQNEEDRFVEKQLRTANRHLYLAKDAINYVLGYAASDKLCGDYHMSDRFSPSRSVQLMGTEAFMEYVIENEKILEALINRPSERRRARKAKVETKSLET